MLTERAIVINADKYTIDSFPPLNCIGVFGFLPNFGCYGFIPDHKQFWPNDDFDFYVVDPDDLLSLEGLSFDQIQKLIDYVKTILEAAKGNDSGIAERLDLLISGLESGAGGGLQ